MPTENQAAVDAVVAQFADRWNRHDTDGLAALFTKDADFVNVVGLWWHGQAEIRERMRANHAIMLKGSRLTNGTVRIKFLDPTVAVAHTAWVLTGERTRDGQAAPPRTGVAIHVAVKDGDGWSLAAFQNTNAVTVGGTPQQ